jgi:hypothetical protein
MTDTEIREALTEIRQAVDVPSVDVVAFRARVRSERRRRTAGRTLVATAAAATVAVGATLWAVHAGEPPAVTPVAVDPTPTSPRLAVVILEGTLQTIDTDGGGYAPGITVEQVLGRTPDGVAVVRQSNPASRLAVVPMKPDGELDRSPEHWTEYTGPVVLQGWLSADGTVLTTAEVDGTVRRRSVGSGDDTVLAHLAAGSQLAAAGPDRWVERTGDGGLRLHTPDAVHDLELGSDGASPTVGRVEVAGPTVAVHTDSGVEFFDSDDGTRLTGELGGVAGALSDDGRLYAGAPTAAERAHGMRGAAYVVDVSTGAVVHLTGLDGVSLEASGAVSWQDQDRFLVVGTDAVRTGNHILWDCSFALRRCDERYDDPTGTLELPTS